MPVRHGRGPCTARWSRQACRSSRVSTRRSSRRCATTSSRSAGSPTRRASASARRTARRTDGRGTDGPVYDRSRSQREHHLNTLLDLLDEAVAAYGDRTALSLRLDDGSTTTWSYRELDRRARIVAWRLRALGLSPGDRVLTWSPSTPELPATYFGAMRAGLILVPLDLRMSSDAIEGVVEASGARHLILGTGRDAPDPREAGLERFPTTTVDAIAADADDTIPADWETQVAAWPVPVAGDVFELVFTSGTTGAPK